MINGQWTGKDAKGNVCGPSWGNVPGFALRVSSQSLKSLSGWSVSRPRYEQSISRSYKSRALPLELTCSVQKHYGNGKFIAVYKKPGIGPYSKPHVSTPQLRTPRDQCYCQRAINLYFSLAISFPTEILHQFIFSTIHATGLTHLVFLGVVTLITPASLHTRDPVLQVPRYVHILRRKYVSIL
jgi:hypothetical protein